MSGTSPAFSADGSTLAYLSRNADETSKVTVASIMLLASSPSPVRDLKAVRPAARLWNRHSY